MISRVGFEEKGHGGGMTFSAGPKTTSLLPTLTAHREREGSCYSDGTVQESKLSLKS